MPPIIKPNKNRNITDFFKTRPVQPQSSTSANAIDRADPNSPRIWPSPRRPRDWSASRASSQHGSPTPMPRPSPLAPPAIPKALPVQSPAEPNVDTAASREDIENSTIPRSPSDVKSDDGVKYTQIVYIPSSPSDICMSDTAPQEPEDILPVERGTVPHESKEILPAEKSDTPAPSGQRIIEKGREVILDSDSEGFSDSDSELEDLSALISGKRNTRSSTGDNSKNPKGSSKQVQPRARPPRQDTPPRPDFRAALREMIKENEESLAVEARIERANAMLAEREHTRMDIDEKAINQNILATSLGLEEDDQKARKIQQAVQRTDALHMDTVWHFFNNGKPTRPPSFPSRHLSPVWTSPAMTSPSSRRELFLSGFVAAWAGTQELPDELVLWILEDLCSGSGDDLQEAYIRVLCESELQLRRVLTADRIKLLFINLNSKPDALETDRTMYPSTEIPRSICIPLPADLVPLLSLLNRAASFISKEATSYALSILIRILYDSSVLASLSALTLARSTIGSLLDSLPSPSFDSILSTLTSSLVSTLTTPTLQATLISALPANSPAQQILKRGLALSFFLETPIRSATHLISPTPTNDILLRLSTVPLYTTLNNQTNYSTLAASMALLNVAVDVGFGLPDTTSQPEAHDPEVLRFNKDVDALAQRLHSIESRIRDSGATDMARMQAKDAVSGLKFRLEGAVRIGVKRKRDVFGDGQEGDIKKLFMRKTQAQQ